MVYKKYKIPTQLKNDVWAFFDNYKIENKIWGSGNKEQQFVGIIGEIMVKMLFGIQHDWKREFDGGFDFQFKGHKIDVKTMTRTVDVRDDFVNNLIKNQIDFDCDIYIFCSLNKRKNELTICGYISKKELLELAVLYKQGTVRRRSNGTTFKMKNDVYEIENNKLKNIEKLFYYLPKYESNFLN